jgi:uncharacterized repeat protein (TIGR01451 family)
LGFSIAYRWVALLLGAAFPAAVLAAGTPAGTLIPNSAVLTYVHNGVPTRVTAASAAVVVARVVGVAVTWQDATAVLAATPDTLRPLAFMVTNTGNGPDTFALARGNTLTGNQFDPADAPQAGIWLESGAQAGFQASGPNADIPYLAGANDITLAADASRLAYAVSSIPAGLTTGASGKALLVARSVVAGDATRAGTQVASAGGVPVVIGAGGPQASAAGSYLVSTVAVGIAKSVQAVADPLGGTLVMSGSVLTYRLVLTVSGAGTASNLVVSDPLPDTLAYVPGSLTVDGTARTDAADADEGSFAAGALQVLFPSLTAPASRVIQFQATVH